MNFAESHFHAMITPFIVHGEPSFPQVPALRKIGIWYTQISCFSGNKCYLLLDVLATTRVKGFIHPISNSWETKQGVLFLPGLRQLRILQENFQEFTAKQ